MAKVKVIDYTVAPTEDGFWSAVATIEADLDTISEIEDRLQELAEVHRNDKSNN